MWQATCPPGNPVLRVQVRVQGQPPTCGVPESLSPAATNGGAGGRRSLRSEPIFGGPKPPWHRCLGECTALTATVFVIVSAFMSRGAFSKSKAACKKKHECLGGLGPPKTGSDRRDRRPPAPPSVAAGERDSGSPQVGGCPCTPTCTQSTGLPGGQVGLGPLRGPAGSLT